MQNSKTDAIRSRISRVEGQVQGIKKMYEGGRSCIEIVQQVQAVRAALAKIASILLTNEAAKCAKKGNISNFQEVVERTFKTM